MGTAVSSSARHRLVPLLSLASATFLYLVFELSPMGLMTELTSVLRASESQIGVLVTIYAVVTGILTIPLMRFVVRYSRRLRLVVAMLILAAGSFVSAGAQDLSWMYVVRGWTAIAHGVLWSTVAPAAVDLVPRERRGGATALVFGGATFGVVVGIPLLRTASALIGWRATFVGLGLLALATALVLGLALAGGTGADSAAGPERPIQRNWRPVLIICGWTVLLVSANFLVYTYFDPLLAGRGWDAAAISLLLMAFGISGVVGTALSGRYLYRLPQLVTAVLLAAYAVAFATLAWLSLPSADVAAVVLWGAGGAAVAPILQAQVTEASAGFEDLASSVYVVCFQVGIAAGSAAGALVAARSGVAALPSLGLGLIVLGAVVVLATWRSVHPSRT